MNDQAFPPNANPPAYNQVPAPQHAPLPPYAQPGPYPQPPQPATPAAPIETYSMFGDLEKWLETYLLQKAPFHLPPSVREFVARIAPWLHVIFCVLAIPLVLALFGLHTLLLPFLAIGGGAVAAARSFTILNVSAVGLVVLYAMAIPGLFHRAKRGWNMAFYAALLSTLSSLLSLEVLGGIVGGLIGFYLLFQLKYLYRN